MAGFKTVRPQAPLNPEADAYGEECLRRSREVVVNARCAHDLAYGPAEDQDLDLYLPDDPMASDAPVLVFFHGGGFTHGYKEWCGFMAPPLVSHPAILVSPAYRLMPDGAVYPEAIEDGVAAIRWVYDNIAQYGGSPDRIFVGGHSAGALLAALIALDHDRLAKVGLPPEVIKGSFCISGTYSRRGMAGQMGYVVPPGPVEVEARSAIALAKKVPGPLLISWGGRERQRERVERTSMMLIGALRDQGCAVEWLFEPEADHFTIHTATGSSASAWVRIVREWFERPPEGVMGNFAPPPQD
jgi:arylformamidase